MYGTLLLQFYAEDAEVKVYTEMLIHSKDSSLSPGLK